MSKRRPNSLDLVQEFHDDTGIITPAYALVPDWTPKHAEMLNYAASMLAAVSLQLKKYGELNGAPRCIVRGRIEIEELGEKLDAMARYDLLGLLDGQGDQRVVADGTALECGLGLVHDEAVVLIHDSNMSKKFPDGTFHRDDSGKIIKGPDYRPVNLRPLLARVTKKDQP